MTKGAITADETADTVASGVCATSRGVPSGSFEEELANDELRYETTGILGRGGMGEVHLARDRRIGRDVALKVIGEPFRDAPESRARFVFEARLQGRLEHPAIVPVHDVGVDPSGAVWFAMRRVRGRTLEEVLLSIRSGEEEITRRYTTRKLLEAFARVCIAVDFVHTHDVLHRDIKPANVMLGDFDEVYLLDWGVAKMLGSGGEGQREVIAERPGTLVGSVTGTPGYMSPEQARGETETLDGRSDVYALGALLFEILTGQRLHKWSTPHEVLAATLRGVDARPSVRAPECAVAPELEALCVDATMVDRDARLPSARVLYERVEAYLDGDRDVARRREMATRLVEDASSEAERALAADDQEARRAALRKLGRALALDPDHHAALRAMVRLLTEPPRTLPAEVDQELLALDEAQVRVGSRVGLVAFLSLNLYLPLIIAMGVRSVAGVAAFFGAATVAGLVTHSLSRFVKHPRSQHSMIVLFFGIAASAIAAGFFGPFLLVPSIATVITVLFSMNHRGLFRAAIIAVAVAGVLLPAVLEWMSILPPSMAFEGDRLVLLPRFVHFPKIASLILLTTVNVAVVVMAALSMAPLRRELDEAQKRIRLTAWQLRQMVPHDGEG